MLLPDRIFSTFRTAARGMEAQRLAMSASAENIANATTSRTEDGTPYALKRVVQTPPAGAKRFSDSLQQAESVLDTRDARHLDGPALRRLGGGAVDGPQSEIVEEMKERLEFDPSHPHADAEGYVHYPDINVVEEMGRMISANRIYEANLSAVQSAKEIIKRTLEM